jgi:uncharacterized membrane protein
MLLQLCEWLQHNWFIVAVNSSVVSASILEILHYASFFLLVGSMAVVDLRILGLAGRRLPANQLAQQAFPWVWTGLGVAIVSGFLMFAVDATEYLHNTVFHEKLGMVLVALLLSVFIQRSLPKWEGKAELGAFAKVVALASLASWIGSILMGVNVPALTGVG